VEAEVEMRAKVVLVLLLLATPGTVRAEQYVLPIFALGWPGKSGNRWTTEVFITNPGPTDAQVLNARFLPGVLRVTTPCYLPIVAFHDVPPHSTLLISSLGLYYELQCPDAMLGGLSFDSEVPVRISSRVVNVREGAPTGTVLSGLGQDLPAFGPGDLSVPGAVYQLPSLVWDPFRCGAPPQSEVYVYVVNPGTSPAGVTIQQTRDGRAGELVVNGQDTPTPFTFTLQPQEWRQMRVELGGALPTVCLPPQVTDLFFVSSAAIAAVASVVDRGSQDARTVLPVRTAD
jgi:hypothetical protein